MNTGKAVNHPHLPLLHSLTLVVVTIHLHRCYRNASLIVFVCPFSGDTVVISRLFCLVLLQKVQKRGCCRLNAGRFSEIDVSK